ncbi:MAG: hypothetical protein ABSE77_03245 [Acidimicrobiales bacterium]
MGGGFIGRRSQISAGCSGPLACRGRQGPGWRWAFFVNPPVCVLVLLAGFGLVSAERRHARRARFDIVGAVLATGGMLLLV